MLYILALAGVCEESTGVESRVIGLTASVEGVWLDPSELTYSIHLQPAPNSRSAKLVKLS